MRIFYAAPGTAHQRELPNSLLWEANLLLPLIDLGHDVMVFDFDYNGFNFNLDPTQPTERAFIEANRPRLGIALLQQLKAEHAKKKIDVFFSYFYSSYVEPDIIKEIGELGIITINWYCNASYQFHLIEEIAPAYSYCLVPEKFRLKDYERIGAHPIYCQEAANPKIYNPRTVHLDYDVTFVGQRYGDRPQYIRALIDAGVDMRVWGPGWNNPSYQTAYYQLRDSFKYLLGRNTSFVSSKYIGPPLSDDELVKMYSRSRISLGFTSLAGKSPDGAPNKQVRLRDFEAPMSGAFYLVEYFDELADFFHPGKEIETFRTPDELVEKVKYYLKHDVEREQIRQAGLARAHSEHTWQKRFEMVFKQIGLT